MLKPENHHKLVNIFEKECFKLFAEYETPKDEILEISVIIKNNIKKYKEENKNKLSKDKLLLLDRLSTMNFNISEYSIDKYEPNYKKREKAIEKSKKIKTIEEFSINNDSDIKYFKQENNTRVGENNQIYITFDQDIQNNINALYKMHDNIDYYLRKASLPDYEKVDNNQEKNKKLISDFKYHVYDIFSNLNIPKERILIILNKIKENLTKYQEKNKNKLNKSQLLLLEEIYMINPDFFKHSNNNDTQHLETESDKNKKTQIESTETIDTNFSSKKAVRKALSIVGRYLRIDVSTPNASEYLLPQNHKLIQKEFQKHCFIDFANLNIPKEDVLMLLTLVKKKIIEYKEKNKNELNNKQEILLEVLSKTNFDISEYNITELEMSTRRLSPIVPF